VLRYRNRYFLLDWKSNTLPSYSPESVAADVLQRGYNLQYRIYLQALKRWLARSVKNFSPERHFGGVLYLYLRGVDPKDPHSGVFFRSPDAHDWSEQKLSDDLRHELNRRGPGQ
jgi:exodeoxyribonuclease V beta subunit